VFPLFLDLPLLTGAEIAHAPHACVTATPWPGPVAVWSALSDDGYALNRVLEQPAGVGITETALAASAPGRWDRGAALRLRIESGSLSSATEAAVLSGANVAAIGNGSAGHWEVFQFASAVLVAPKTYEITLRLRGQAGTDGLQPEVWPAGSTFVLLNQALQQLDLPLSARGLDRFYRVGAADRGYDAGSTVLRVEAFDGIGLRPYPVAHMRAKRHPNGDLAIDWIRRTRLDGDSWQSIEVPLGEANESYQVQVWNGTGLLRQVTTGAANWAYTQAQQSADSASGAVTITVAQLSQSFGAGPARHLSVVL
jgi:hypothetical protein